MSKDYEVKELFSLKVLDKSVSVYDYSDLAYCITTEKDFGINYSERLKGLGGLFNHKLTINQRKVGGWVLSKKKVNEQSIKDFFNQIETGKIKRKGKGKKIYALIEEISTLLKTEKECVTECLLNDEDEKYNYFIRFGKSEELDKESDEDDEITDQLTLGSRKIIIFKQKY